MESREPWGHKYRPHRTAVLSEVERRGQMQRSACITLGIHQDEANERKEWQAEEGEYWRDGEVQV